jgi:hypothetical protein
LLCQQKSKAPFLKKIKRDATAAIWREYGSLRVWAALNNVDLTLLRDVLRGRNRGKKRWTKGYAIRRKLEKQGLLPRSQAEKTA